MSYSDNVCDDVEWKFFINVLYKFFFYTFFTNCVFNKIKKLIFKDFTKNFTQSPDTARRQSHPCCNCPRICTSINVRLLALCQVSKIVIFTEKEDKYACFYESLKSQQIEFFS